MFVRYEGEDLEVLVHHPAATDADLARAAGMPEPLVPRRLADVGLRSGQTLEHAIATDHPAPPAGPVVTVVGGPDAGSRVPLPVGAVLRVGRSATNDLAIDDAAVSRAHARLAVDLEGRVALADGGSRNGSWAVGPVAEPVGQPRLLDGSAAVRIGRSRLALAPPAVGDEPLGGIAGVGAGGTSPHNRPPRVALAGGPEPIAVPHPPAPSGPRLPLGVVAILGPIAMAGAMVWLLGNPAFALFALLSPVLAIGNHVEGRRRERKGSRREAVAWAAAVAAFRRAIAAAGEVELVRRRASAPDLAEVLRRAEQPATTLWERRPSHDDWLRVRLGTGDLRWEPPLRDERHGPRHPDVADALDTEALLREAPATVELAGGGVVGVVGPRPLALAVARSLVVQLAVHHGPSDLEVLVACDEAAVADWDWAKWLPHVEDATGGPRRLAAGRAAADALADARLDRRRAARSGRPGRDGPAAALLVIVADGDDLLAGRRAPLRALLDGRGGPSAGIVVAASVDRLPSACTSVVVLGDDGAAELRLPAVGSRVLAIDPDGLSVGTAARGARALARFDDPELDVTGAGLPAIVSLLELLGEAVPTGATLAARWAAGGPDPSPRGPIGVDGDGVVEVDLAVDGPHVLVAGTTGAGKSELLRTLVAGLAACSPPEHLTFLLIDFKGGSAFDACERLPHTVGLVTDLDAELAERALRCLEAELRHRERVLRAAGAADLTAYRSAAGCDPLPRLVVVVDEFATLKTELPDFVDALVGVAQRGRSLGVHLVLATQRPAGSVSDHIKANANLRIALRVQDPADSVDVIDEPLAAALPRGRPGRACLRLGPGEVLTVQTALATAESPGGRPPVELRPFRFVTPPVPEGAGRRPASDLTDLDRLVDAAIEAFVASGRPAPRRPWPDPLPARIELPDLAADPGTVVVGIADDPDRQAQRPAGWRPAEGNLLVFGVGRTGTTTTLLAVARALAATTAPAALQLFALDCGAGELAALQALPHTGAVVAATERERQQRLVRHLRAELDRRRAAPTGTDRRPDIVVLVDGIGRFLGDFDDLVGMDVVDAFSRVFTDGPEVGISVVAAGDRAGAVPGALAATVRQRWVHRLADALDAATVGAGAAQGARCTTLPAGRYLDVTSGLVVQVAAPAAGWAEALASVAASWPAVPAAAAPAIRALPGDVPLQALPLAVVGESGPWRLPIGVGDDDGPGVLTLHDGDHVLVAGPGRSGRTTALATIGTAVLRANPGAAVVALAGRRSWLPQVPGVVTGGGVEAAVALVTEAIAAGRPALLLVDDADAVDDVGGVLEGLLTADGVHVAAAGRADVLRGLYAHWTRIVRRSRLGVLLRPNHDLDGELLATALPRRSAAPWVDGRGYLVVDGVPVLVQVARCQDADP